MLIPKKMILRGLQNGPAFKFIKQISKLQITTQN